MSGKPITPYRRIGLSRNIKPQTPNSAVNSPNNNSSTPNSQGSKLSNSTPTKSTLRIGLSRSYRRPQTINTLLSSPMLTPPEPTKPEKTPTSSSIQANMCEEYKISVVNTANTSDNTNPTPSISMQHNKPLPRKCRVLKEPTVEFSAALNEANCEHKENTDAYDSKKSRKCSKSSNDKRSKRKSNLVDELIDCPNIPVDKSNGSLQKDIGTENKIENRTAAQNMYKPKENSCDIININQNIESVVKLPNGNVLEKADILKNKIYPHCELLPDETTPKRTVSRKLSLRRCSTSISKSQVDNDSEEEILIKRRRPKIDRFESNSSVASSCSVYLEKLSTHDLSNIVYNAIEAENLPPNQQDCVMEIDSTIGDLSKVSNCVHNYAILKDESDSIAIVAKNIVPSVNQEAPIDPGFNLESLAEYSTTDLTNEELINEIMRLERQFKQKQTDVETLKQSIIYRQLHNVDQLNAQKSIWQNACKIILADFLAKLREITQGDMSMDQLLRQMGISRRQLQFDV